MELVKEKRLKKHRKIAPVNSENFSAKEVEHESAETLSTTAPVCGVSTPSENTDEKNSSLVQNKLEVSECQLKENIVSLEQSTEKCHISSRLAVQPDVQELGSNNKHSECVGTLISSSLTKSKLYPSVKNLELDVEAYHSIIEAHSDSFKTKVSALANRAYTDFITENLNLERHEFFESLKQYENCRYKLCEVQSKVRCLNASVKSKKENLWITKPKTVLVEGKCDDGNVVKALHKYSIQELDEVVFNEVRDSLQELMANLPVLAFSEYSLQLLQEKIQVCVYALFKKVSANSPKNLLLEVPSPLSGCNADKATLRMCVSVLFHFQRMPVVDDSFVILTRQWLSDLVPILLNSGLLEDRLFIINNVLRCPSGIDSWASQFVQLPSESSESERFQFFMTVLFMVLTPVHKRDDFLQDVGSPSASATDASIDSMFVILDLDGQEVKEKYKYVKMWNEADVLALFRQIPLSYFFDHVDLYLIEDCQQGRSEFKELKMQKLIALFYFLNDLFQCGLLTYRGDLHNAVVTVIGRFICRSLSYVAAQWQEFKSVNIIYNCCLQIEYDRLMFHVVYCMLSSEQFETLEFLKAVPYDTVSAKVLWNLLWLFHCYPDNTEGNLFAVKNANHKVRSQDSLSQLQMKLDTVYGTQAKYVIKAMNEMALCKVSEKELTLCITREIFEVMLSKPEECELFVEARSSVAAIAGKCPFVITSLLEVLNAADETSFSAAVILFEQLCLGNWMPMDIDFDRISDWLLCGPLSSHKNKLSRLILSKLNWNFESGRLVLPIELHRKVGFLVVKAYMKYDANGERWFFSKGIDQMLQLYASIRCQKFESDGGFIFWAWCILFSLKLHVLNRQNPPWINIFDGRVVDDNLPDLYEDVWLHDLLIAYNGKQPAACFLVLAMTNVGHNMKYLPGEGVDVVISLVQSKQYAAAVQSLFFVLPFFVKYEKHLLTNRDFMCCFCDLILADRSSFSSKETVVGTVLSKMYDMMTIQISQAFRLTVECANPLIKLWLQLLLELLVLEDNNGQLRVQSASNQVYYLLDGLTRMAFMHSHTRDGLLQNMYELMRLPRQPVSKKSFWKLWGFRSDVIVSSFLLPQASPNYAWFSWCLVLAEVSLMPVRDLWSTVEKEMFNDPVCTPESAVKKAVLIVPSSSPLTVCHLPVYRWCLLAVVTPVGHPLLPLMWQQFFTYFLHKPNASDASRQSIGFRYFKTGEQCSLFAKVKSKLKATVGFYHKELDSSGGCSTGSLAQLEIGHEDLTIAEKCFLILRTVSKWIEEPKLTACATSFITSIEPKYLRDKLKLLFDQDYTPWFDLIAVEKVSDEIMPKENLWNFSKVIDSPNHSDDTSVCEERNDALNVLDLCPEALAPPSVNAKRPTVHEISNKALSSWDTLSKLVSQNQGIICDEAEKFQSNMTKLRKLNAAYLNMIPQEVQLEESRCIFSKSCYKEKTCSGAARFNIKSQKVVHNDRMRLEIYRNRSDFASVLKKLRSPPGEDLCSAAVHMEICMRKLLQKINTASNLQSVERLSNMGVSLFYDQLLKAEKAFPSDLNFGNEYSPLKQFFSVCIEILGRELIMDNEDQLIKLVSELLKHPSVAGLASPFFCPQKASVKTLLSVYDTVISCMQKSSLCSVFALLSKIKLKQWLSMNRVLLPQRKELLTKISVGLTNCGANPTDEELVVCEILKKHFCTVLMYEFPELLTEAVQILVGGSEAQCMSIDVWFGVFNCLGCTPNKDNFTLESVKSEAQNFALNRMLSADQKIYVVCPSLPLVNILEILNYLHDYFTKQQQQCSPQTLYGKFSEYVKVISTILCIFGHSLLELTVDDHLTPGTTSKVRFLWSVLHHAFQPWIDPLLKDGSVQFPWSLNEKNKACVMLNLFAACIEFHAVHFKDERSYESILSYCWKYYVKTYIRLNVRKEYIILFQSAFADISWHLFHPTAEDIQCMQEVLNCEISECREFFSSICMRIPWLEVMSELRAMCSSYTVGYTLALLAKLFISFSWECTVVKNTKLQKMLKKLEKMPWILLTTENIEEIVDQFCHLCIPINLLCKTDDVTEFYVLNFVKVVVGMIPISKMTKQVVPEEIPQLKEKRLIFVHKFISLLGHHTLTDKNTTQNIEKFAGVVPDMLCEIEAIVSEDFPSSEQTAAAEPLLNRVLPFINMAEKFDFHEEVVKSLLHWLNSNHRTLLLLPCIKTVCRCVTKMSVVVAVTECCIAALYSVEFQDPYEAKEVWNIVSACIHIPESEVDVFILSCVEQSAFFTLYEYVLRRCCLSNTANSRVLLLSKIVHWVKSMKPCVHLEAKTFLLWDKILELSLIVASENDLQVVQETLSIFCRTLCVLGGDKEKSGIFGAVGLGKASVYSVNFRFMCRAVASFVFSQIPESGSLRLERNASGHFTEVLSSDQKKAVGNGSSAHPSVEAQEAFKELQQLINRKPYSALKMQVQKTMNSICDPECCLQDSRQFLKDLALQVFPGHSCLLLL